MRLKERKYLWPRIISIVTSIFWASSIWSFSEVEINKAWDSVLLKFVKDNGKISKFKSFDEKTINYIKLEGKGKKGGLVFLAGQGDPYIRYYEALYDLQKRGYSPIYAMDHRGQGQSERILPDDPLKGHVEDFHHYIRDFDFFIKKVVSPGQHKKLYLIAHSMAGAISTLYLMDRPENQKTFKAVALVAPMFMINGGYYPNTVMKLMSKALCLSKKMCREYAPGLKGSNLLTDYSKNTETSSKARWMQSQRFSTIYKKAFISGPTSKWVYEALGASSKIGRYGGKIKTPIILLQAGKDSFVRPKAQKNFCKKSASQCQLVILPESLHSILAERDPIRNLAFKHITSYFDMKF